MKYKQFRSPDDDEQITPIEEPKDEVTEVAPEEVTENQETPEENKDEDPD